MSRSQVQVIHARQPHYVRGLLLLGLGAFLATTRLWVPQSWRGGLDFDYLANGGIAFSILPFILGIIDVGPSHRVVIDPGNDRLTSIKAFFGIRKRTAIRMSTAEQIRIKKAVSRAQSGTGVPRTVGYPIYVYGDGKRLDAGLPRTYAKARVQSERLAEMLDAPILDLAQTPVYDEEGTSRVLRTHDNLDSTVKDNRGERGAAEVPKMPVESRIEAHVQSNAAELELPPIHAPWYGYALFGAIFTLLLAGSVAGVFHYYSLTTSHWAHALWSIPIVFGAALLYCLYGAMSLAGRYERISITPHRIRQEWVYRTGIQTKEIEAKDVEDFGYTEPAVQRVQTAPHASVQMNCPAVIARSDTKELQLGLYLTPAEAKWLHATLQAFITAAP